MNDKKPSCRKKSCDRCVDCEIGNLGYGRRCLRFMICAVSERQLHLKVQELQRFRKMEKEITEAYNKQ